MTNEEEVAEMTPRRQKVYGLLRKDGLDHESAVETSAIMTGELKSDIRTGEPPTE